MRTGNFRISFFAMLLLLCFNNAAAQWTNGQNAAIVIGQSNFTSYATGTFNNPKKVVIDFANGKIYVVNQDSYCVQRFAYPFTSSTPTVERTFGVSGSRGATQTQFQLPTSAAVYNGVLWVCDEHNHRILKFNNAATAAADAPSADGVIGQADFVSSTHGGGMNQLYWPCDITIDASGNMWVVDNSNDRVLKFNDVNSKEVSNASADLVLGVTGSAATTSNEFYLPKGIAVYGTTVWVGDSYGQRVLRFDNPTSSGVAASGVLGQSNFTSTNYGTTSSTFSYPGYMAVDNSGRLYVNDETNRRILIFNNAASIANGAAADVVLGQPDFTTNSRLGGQNGFGQMKQSQFGGSFPNGYPGSIAVDPVNNKLLVLDPNDNRILQFAASNPLPVELASFTASSEKNGVTLHWKTATETNNYGFEIQRSDVSTQHSAISAQQSAVSTQLQDNMWSKIGFVEGNGTTNAPKSYSFTNRSANGKTSYRLKQIDRDGKFVFSQTVEVTAPGTPKEFVLEQNHPNPFNPTTAISYKLPANSFTTLKIYDTIGREVATLVNEVKNAGYYSAQFDGARLSSGIYFAKLSSSGKTQMKKLLLMK